MDNPDIKPMPPTPCPRCGFMCSEGEVSPGSHIERDPGPGDFVVCPRCMALTAFTEDMKLRMPTQEEMHRIVAEMSNGTESGTGLLLGIVRLMKRREEWRRRVQEKVSEN